MRPILRAQQPTTYTPGDNLGTKKNTLVYKAFKRQITLDEATDGVWLVTLVDNKLEKRKKPYDDYQPLVNNIYDTLEGRYPAAGQALIDNFGLYCCYCEIAAASYEIDHEAPKRPLIRYIVQWNNLLPTCPICNRLKSNKPGLDDMKGKVTNPKSQTAYWNYLLDSYIWPDASDTSYPDLRPMLHTRQNGQWVPLSDQLAYSTDIATTDRPQDRTVRCTFTTGPGKTKTYDCQARILGNNGRQSEIDTIDLLSLNRVQDDEKITDYRIYRRTQTWFAAQLKIRRLLKPLTDSEFDEEWADLIRTASLVGFYSVWVTLLARWDRNGNLGRKFIVDTAQQFPGTNPSILNQVP